MNAKQRRNARRAAAVRAEEFAPVIPDGPNPRPADGLVSHSWTTVTNVIATARETAKTKPSDSRWDLPHTGGFGK